MLGERSDENLWRVFKTNDFISRVFFSIVTLTCKCVLLIQCVKKVDSQHSAFNVTFTYFFQKKSFQLIGFSLESSLI